MIAKIIASLFICTVCLFANAQNVGIGTTTPTVKLDIVTDSATGDAGQIRLNAPNLQPNIGAPISIGGTVISQGKNNTIGNQAEWRFNFVGDNVFDNYQTFGFSGLDPAMTIRRASGSVGIGTIDPEYNSKLSVKGNAFFNNGSVGIGTTNPYGSLHIQNGNLVMAESDIDFYYFGNYRFWSMRGQDDKFAIIDRMGDKTPFYINRGSGNVGINNTSPQAKLDVTGNLKIADGTEGAGKVLTSDANGLASWITFANNDWGLNGNAGTSAANFLGTTDNRSLRFRTNNSAKMIIDSLGNVGIGTALPVGEFHIRTIDASLATIDQQQTTKTGGAGGSSNWQSFTAGITGRLSKVDLFVGSPLGGLSAPGTIKIYDGEGTGGTLLSTTAVLFQGSIGFKSFNLSNYVNVIAGNKYTIEFSTPTVTVGWVDHNNNNPYFGGTSNVANRDYLFKTYVTNTTSDAFIINNGKIGIGTASPLAKLDVTGNVKFTDGTQGAGKVLTSDESGLATWQAVPQNIGTGTSAGNTTYWNGSAWVTNNSNIFNNGANVGIGTTTPSAKLDIAGNIKIADGTQSAGKVLTSDASGLATWQAVQQDIGIGTSAGNTTYWNGTAWVTNSSNIFNNGANVGIGTATPSNKLSVEGNADFTGNVGIGTSSPLGELHIKTIDVGSATLDQSQTTSTGGDGEYIVWQSFTAGTTGRMTKIELFVGSPSFTNPSIPGTIQIISGEGSGGSILSTTSVVFQSPSSFKTFNLSNPVSVIAGNKYTILFSTSIYTANWVYKNTNNPYAGGRSSFAVDADILFKTYVESLIDGFIVKDGKVGIGTTNPQANLHIESANTSGPAGLIKLNSPNMTAGNLTGIVQGRNGSLANQAEWVFSYLGDGNLNNYQGFGFNAIQPFVAFTASEKVGIGTTAPTAKLSVNGTANNTTGSWGVFSDARIKTVNSDFTDGLNVINKIHTVKFNYNANAPFSQKAEQIGIVAQELEKIAPYMVSQKEFGNIKDLREVDNQAYVFLLINAVKELSAQNEQLKAEMELIKNKLGMNGKEKAVQ